MIDLQVDVVDASGVLGMISGIREQIPYIAATSLNITADKSQQAVRASLPEHFVLRRQQFVERTIYRGRDDFAKKDRLAATIRINPERNVLAKFETDHVKRSRDGGSLAVPIIRTTNKAMVIGRGSPLSLARVMALIDQQGGKQIGPFKKSAAKRAARQSFFLLHSRKGNTVILQRDGATTRVIYAFTDEVPIEPDLHFGDIALKTALANWSRNAEDAIARAIATMR